MRPKAPCACMKKRSLPSRRFALSTKNLVIEQANHTPYGLSAYVFTSELSRIFRLGENLDAGIIGVNDGVPTATQAPFGGVKESGWGRELGTEGIDAFLVTKHLSLGI